jgi:hypothetical protein
LATSDNGLKAQPPESTANLDSFEPVQHIGKRGTTTGKARIFEALLDAAHLRGGCKVK